MNQPIAKIEEYRPAQFTAWTPTFIVSVPEMIARVKAKREFMQQVMVEGEHYGRPPGVSKDAKPGLFKAGAELLLSAFGLSAELSDGADPEQDYDGQLHGGVALISYRSRCRIYKQIGANENDRVLIAQADGFCSSRETKYRYREGGRRCLSCGAGAIIKGKIFDDGSGGGWFCFPKKGGCGEKYQESDTRITSQQLGRVENPDIADQENTILKMSQKRAYVAATLLGTGCSDIFTQDTEDMHPDDMKDVTPRETSGRQSNRSDAPPESTEPVTDAQIADIEKLWGSMPQGERYGLVARITKGKAREIGKTTAAQARLVYDELKKNQPPAALITQEGIDAIESAWGEMLQTDRVAWVVEFSGGETNELAKMELEQSKKLYRKLKSLQKPADHTQATTAAPKTQSPPMSELEIKNRRELMASIEELKRELQWPDSVLEAQVKKFSNGTTDILPDMTTDNMVDLEAHMSLITQTEDHSP